MAVSRRARLVVMKTGQFFTVEDREVKEEEGKEGVLANDILFKPRVKNIQNIKSVLGECCGCVSSVRWDQLLSQRSWPGSNT